MRMHPDQLSVSVDTVRALVDEQFPRWRSLPVRAVKSQGTVNAIVRIGDRLAARFPLNPGEIEAVRAGLESEARAARELAGRTRFATPEPVAIGEPGAGYPLVWSVQTWLPGVTATDQDPAGSVRFAHELAELVAGLRAMATSGRTHNGRGRGGVIGSHEEWVELCLARSGDLLDVPRLRRLWAAMRELPRGDDPDVMSHCDLIPGNVLVQDRHLAGVLDVGGFGPADPALDLVGGWHLLDAGPRLAFRGDLGVADDEWARGRAWAFVQAIGAVWYYVESNPAMCRMGRRTLDRILADVRP